MASEKKLYRSRGTWGGGVCSGIAKYFNIDPIIVQILTIVLTIPTAGALIIVYVALWIILPKDPDPAMPVEVQAHAVHSDTYGHVNYHATKNESESAMPDIHSQQNNVHDSFVGTASVPPAPPKGFEGTPVQFFTVANHAAHTSAYSIRDGLVEGASTQTSSQTDQGYTAVPPSAPVSPVDSSGKQVPYAPQSFPTSIPPQSQGRDRSVSGALWFGLILLFVGVCALLGTFVDGVEWWQFWPLVFIIVGIGQMVVPGKKGRRMSHFVNGLMQFSFGAAALPFTLGTVAFSSLELIFVNLWPILVIMCGFFVLGGAMRAPIFTFLAGLSFLAFCIIGLVWFVTPGTIEVLTFSLPSGQIYFYDINPWK